jgi:hypothetical protein
MTVSAGHITDLTPTDHACLTVTPWGMFGLPT